MDVDLQRMIKIEDKILRIAREDLKLDFNPVEFDIIPDQKMLEIMAYRMPTQISNWKFGRDYEKLRTINEVADAGLPYEVVINSNPARAYLMNSNTFAIQILVMAHVIGHAAFHKMNRNFHMGNQNIVDYMYNASQRINKFEKSYGTDEVERIVDAGHALQFHSSPFDNETEDEKRKRVFEQHKKIVHGVSKASFGDFTTQDNEKNFQMDVALYNQKLWRQLLIKTPVEPTEDLLRYIIDNSSILEEWQKYILEILREEGRYYNPIIKTKYMNEGFATYVHQYIMKKLFKEGTLNATEYGEFSYSNSLVKAMNPAGMNPYLIGCEIWEDIVRRWDKGQYGDEWEECKIQKEKDEWDTGEMKGHEKMLDILSTYNDWFFMQNFLTNELVRDLKLYIYVMQETPESYDFVITKHKIKEIKKLIVKSFSHSRIPKIEVKNGNYANRNELMLVHDWSGIDLDKKYSEETLKHIFHLWGRPIHLKTKTGNRDVMYSAQGDPKGRPKVNVSLIGSENSKVWVPSFMPKISTITAMSNIMNT